MSKKEIKEKAFGLFNLNIKPEHVIEAEQMVEIISKKSPENQIIMLEVIKSNLIKILQQSIKIIDDL